MTSARPLLRVGVRQTIPATILTEDDKHGIRVGGVMGDVLDTLSDSLNFDYRPIKVPDNQFGSPMENGFWTGMIGMIQRNEVEFALGPFSTTFERESVIDFSVPVFHSNLAILTIRPTTDYDMEGLIKPFTLEVWLCILCSVFIIILALTFVENIEASLNDCKTTAPAKTVMLPIKALTQESSEWLPKRSSGRFLVAIWLLASLIFSSSFGGILTAMLTVPKVSIPIDSLEDLVSQTKMPWRMLPGTFLLKYFKESKYDVHKKAFHGLSGTISSPWDSKGDIIDGKFAIITEETEIKTIIAWDYSTSGRCHLYMAKKYVYSNNLYSMAFQTNSSYLERANKVINSLMESGILPHWYRRYHTNATQCLRPPSSDRTLDEATALNVKVFGSSFILIAGGYALSLLAFLWEKIRE